MSKLPNAPLKEVIFEVRWDADINPENNQLFDKGYALALGVFKNLVKSHFPIAKQITDIPANFIFGKVIHQFWKSEKEWPVLQIGPGILTINCTETNYDWQNDFFELIQKTMAWHEQAYENKMNYSFVTLRYIDSVNLKDFGTAKLEDFLNTNFNFGFNNLFYTKGPLKQLQFDQVFELEDSSGLHIAFSNAENSNKEPTFVWQTAINKVGIQNKDSIIKWCEFAHETSSTVFKEMLKPEFYDRFS